MKRRSPARKGGKVAAWCRPTRKTTTCSNDDMTDFESYYGLAPSDFVSKKLTSYAQRFSVLVSWVKARGDTDGRAT